jgi:DNA-binding transcriptional LysR family regulator
MSVSPEGLRCFLEAARLASFRAAARRVGLSPAALGQQIKRLEDELGARLFARSTRSVALTEAGQHLLPFAEKALASIEDCARAVQREAPALEAELVLGTRHELGMSWVVPLVERLQAAFPKLVIHLYFGSGPDLLLRVRTGEIDCAVTSTRLTDPKLDSFRLHEERYVFVGAPALLKRNPLQHAAQASAHTLFDTTAELPLFGYVNDTPGASRLDSMNFGQVVRLGTIAAIRRFVLAGRGVAVLPEYFVATDLRRKRLVLIHPRVHPRSDWFRLVFRASDPKRKLLESIAERMLAFPLR